MFIHLYYLCIFLVAIGEQCSYFLNNIYYFYGCQYFSWMYWSDWGEEGRIERAGLDGTHRQIIVSFDIKWPNGLTIDLIRHRLYWADAKLNLISSVNYDGSGRTVILKSSETLHHPFSISVFEDVVYWTDWEKQTIFKANKFNGSNVTPLTPIRKVKYVYIIF